MTSPIRATGGPGAAIIAGLSDNETEDLDKARIEYLLGGKEAADAFYSDPDYQPHLQGRLAGATNHFFLIEAKDDFAA